MRSGRPRSATTAASKSTAVQGLIRSPRPYEEPAQNPRWGSYGCQGVDQHGCQPVHPTAAPSGVGQGRRPTGASGAAATYGGAGVAWVSAEPTIRPHTQEASSTMHDQGRRPTGAPGAAATYGGAGVAGISAEPDRAATHPQGIPNYAWPLQGAMQALQKQRGVTLPQQTVKRALT